MTTNVHSLEFKWSQLIARAWENEEFKSRLIADPSGVLKESGLTLSPDTQVEVIENTETVEQTGNVFRLPLPVKPGSDEFSGAEFVYAAGGNRDSLGSCSSDSTRCRP